MNPLDNTTWPPPPAFTEAPFAAFRVGTVIILQTANTLYVTNLAARRVLWGTGLMAILFAVLLILFPLMLMSASGYRIHTMLHYLPLVWHHEASMILMCIVFIFVFLLEGRWLYNGVLHRGLYVMDRQTNWLLLGGKNACPLPNIENVTIKLPSPYLTPTWQVCIYEMGAIPLSLWQALRSLGHSRKITHIGFFRKEADARRVAEAIADFVGVPVSTA